MRIPVGVRKLSAVLIAAIAVFALFFSLARPRYLRWGATPAELAATYPGEELFPDAGARSVRAVTIAAPADEVWPWIAQVGQDRGGFYSYEVLEDLVGSRMPRATSILPEHQAWRPGDRLWMYPQDKVDGAGSARLLSYAPGRHLMFASRALGATVDDPEVGLWGFAVQPVDAGHTRLLAVSRSSREASPLVAGFARAVFEPAHYVMERRMLLNVRELAEGGTTSRAGEIADVMLWTLTLLLLLVALAAVARRRRWWPALVVAVLAAITFQVLTLLQPPTAVSAGLVLWLGASLWWRGDPIPLRRARPAGP